MATTNATQGLHGAGIVKKATGWFIAMAALFILLGMFSIAEPFLAGLGVTLLVGWLLVIGRWRILLRRLREAARST